MPKVAKELTALDVKRLPHPVRTTMVAVGGVAGLHINCTPSGGRSWVLKVTIGGKRREVGLGGYPEVGLAAAREAARDVLAKVRLGDDPMQERKAAKLELVAAQGQTFQQAAQAFLKRKLKEFENPKHRQQWENTLATYAYPKIGRMDVDAITPRDVVKVLEPIWADNNETASRLRGRIEKVLDAAQVEGHRPHDAPNPARWTGNLEHLLAARKAVAKGENQPAVKIAEAPAFFAALRKREGTSARALEFACLCASRSGEVRGALG